MKNCPYLVVVLLKLISESDTINGKYRSKRANIDNFNILLGIYKMNPLKHSDVFKAFSNRVLLPRPDERHPDLNLNSNESREKENRTNTKTKTEDINYAERKSVIDGSLYMRGERENFNTDDFHESLESMIRAKLDSKEKNLTQKFTEQIQSTVEELENCVTEPTPNNSSERNAGPKVFNMNNKNNNNVRYDEAEIVIV